MKNFKKLVFVALALISLSMSSCLHIVEELTFRKSGNGAYKFTLDMSEAKSMMEMLKGMSTDSASTGGTADPMGGAGGMTQMAQEITGVAQNLKSLPGITNVVELSDTSNFTFGYTFDFADVKALNNALKTIGKEKGTGKSDIYYKYDGKNFERTSAGDLGEEMKKSLSEGEEEAEAGSMDMMKQFFADMSYKMVYNFPDQTIKKNNNELGQISEDKHAITVTLKPFDDEMAKKKMTVATVLKLK